MIEHTFGVVDSIVFIATLGISVLIGVYFAFVKKQKTNSDLLVGGRNMSIFPIAMSLLATYMSAILVLGMAGEIYGHGTLICISTFGALIFIPLGGVLFLPTLYNLRLTSAYEYLEKRFESKVARLLATATFIIQMVMYLGVVLYAPSIAMEPTIGLPIWLGITIIGGSAAIYTSIGGIKAVVWTDVFQIIMMFAGMIAVIIQGSINVGGLPNAIKIADDHGRIEFFNWTIDPFTRHTTLTVLFGQGALWLGAYGCHQTTVQRYCSMSSFTKAFTALVVTGPTVAFTMVLAGLCGILIVATYADCDPLTLGFIKSYDQIAPYFVLEFLSPTAGLVGLFMSCLLSGALSTVSSGLNSLAAVTWEDFLKHARVFRVMTDVGQGAVVKVVGLIYGGLIIFMGFVVSQLGGILPVTITVNGALSGPLLGIFVLGVFVPFANKYGAIVGILCGHSVNLWIGLSSLIIARKTPHLEFSIAECSNETLSSANQTILLAYRNSTANMELPLPDVEWPEKLYTVSYLLYPIIGSCTTVIVGSIISLLTGPTRMTKDREKYIHPFIVKICRCCSRGRSQGSNFEMSGMRMSNGHAKNGDKKNGEAKNGHVTERRRAYDNPGFDTS